MFDELENIIINNKNIDLDTTLIFLDLIQHHTVEYYQSAKNKIEKLKKMTISLKNKQVKKDDK